MWQEVRKGIGGRTDIDTEIKNALNEATLDISMMFRIRELIQFGSADMVDGNTVLDTLGDDILDVISVRDDTDAVPLKHGTIEQFDSLDYEDTDSEGTPTQWVVDGSYLRVFNPTPDDGGNTISYRYVTRLTEMTADTTPFVLPREWERPAKLLAKSYVFELLGQNEKAIAAFQQMQALVASRNTYKYFEDIYNTRAQVSLSYGAGTDEGY
jgi:hypothetical protein